MTTMERVKLAVSSTLECDADAIQEDDTLLDLGASSLDLIEIPFDLAAEFNNRQIMSWFKEEHGEITIRQITEKIHEHLRVS